MGNERKTEAIIRDILKTNKSKYEAGGGALSLRNRNQIILESLSY